MKYIGHHRWANSSILIPTWISLLPHAFRFNYYAFPHSKARMSTSANCWRVLCNPVRLLSGPLSVPKLTSSDVRPTLGEHPSDEYLISVAYPSDVRPAVGEHPPDEYLISVRRLSVRASSTFATSSSGIRSSVRRETLSSTTEAMQIVKLVRIAKLGIHQPWRWREHGGWVSWPSLSSPFPPLLTMLSFRRQMPLVGLGFKVYGVLCDLIFWGLWKSLDCMICDCGLGCYVKPIIGSLNTICSLWNVLRWGIWSYGLMRRFNWALFLWFDGIWWGGWLG